LGATLVVPGGGGGLGARDEIGVGLRRGGTIVVVPSVDAGIGLAFNFFAAPGAGGGGGGADAPAGADETLPTPNFCRKVWHSRFDINSACKS
jgi:hypothetical protein